MKILLLFFLICSFQVVSQEDTTVYQYVDEDAEFPGGTSALMMWIHKNVCYPEISDDDILYAGKIHLEFVIERDGSISHIVVNSKCIPCKEAYINLMEISPKWIPAKLNGNNVRSIYRMPIRIEFE